MVGQRKAFLILGKKFTKVGLTKPTVLFFAAIRSSLIRFRIAAKTGADAEVPPMRVGAPLLMITTLSPTAAKSGYPRPGTISGEQCQTQVYIPALL